MTVVVAFQGAVAALQADNAALRQRMAHIESLPGIRRRLEIVAPQ